ncbi:pre-mRNA-splicing factor CWC26, partial [Phenoliferia sp. Uapishka_3]
MSDLKTYLASKYGSGLKAEAILARADATGDGKRRKKKRSTAGAGGSTIVAPGGGLVIADDDGMTWGTTGGEDEEEEGRPVVEERRGHFKPASANSWATVRPADPSLARTPTPEPEDESPVVVPTVAPSRGGLQSASQLRAENERRAAELALKKASHAKELAALKKAARDRGDDEEDIEDPGQTVYRDKDGRKIDVKLEKANRKKEERDKVEREMKKMEWGKGLVQKGEAEEKKREEEKMKSRPLARYADDKDMNDELRDRDRWNDPAANFLTVRLLPLSQPTPIPLLKLLRPFFVIQQKEKKLPKTSAPRFPKYTGPAPPPNRFGIPPGYRWDGVDRSNGFEAMYMQRGNAGKMRAAESHAWSTSEM